MENFFKQLKKIKLSGEEKDSLKTFFVNYVKNNPVRNESLSRLQLRKDNDYSGAFVKALDKGIIAVLLKLKIIPVLTSLVLMVFVGASVSMAAENSLPGDILYPVKIKVVENIKSAFILSPKNKAEFEIERADRRFREIEMLSNKGRLDTDAIDRTEKELTKHINKVVEISSELKSQNRKEEAMGLDSTLETTLLIHKEASDNIASGTSSQKEAVRARIEGIRDKIEIKAKEVGKERIRAENEIKSASDSDKKGERRKITEEKLRMAEDAVSKAKKSIEENKEKSNKKISEKTGNFVKEAESFLNEGRNKISSGEYGDAFVNLQKTERFARTAEKLTEINNVLPDLEIKESFEFERRIRDGNTEIEIKEKGDGGKEGSNKVNNDVKKDPFRSRDNEANKSGNGKGRSNDSNKNEN